MAYEVLALKYRPKVFEDLVGQEAVTRTLTNAIQQDRIAHAFLFAGVRGVGKTTTARILAKALNCESGPTVRPCGTCAACEEIARGRSLDVLEIDGASNAGVEQVRELIDSARYAPSRDRFKIYIIDEVHMLSTAAFNALLKTLEEPPPTVKFIFATTEHHKIPDTILSRCQEHEFRTVAPGEIANQLRMIAKAEGIEITEGAIRTLARAASGSMRDGISALDQVIAASSEKIEEHDVTELLGLIERDVLRQTANALTGQDTASILKIVNELVRSGRDLRNFISALMQYFRDILVAKVAPEASELFELPDETAGLEKFAGELSEEDLLRALELLTQTEIALRSSPEPRFHVEVALLKLSQLRKLASFEDLLERFEALVAGEPPPPSSGSAPKPAAKPRVVAKPTKPKTEASPSPEAKAGPPPQATQDASAPDDWTARDDFPPLSEAEGEPSSDFMSQLIEQLKTAKPMLHAIVSRHTSYELDGNRLTLKFLSSQKVLAEQLEQKMLKDLLEEQASRLADRKLSVTVRVQENGASKDAPPPAPIETEDKSSEDLQERARRDPLVRQFIDTFQGEIQSVKKPEA
ncbi:MAG: DNA polymerase III subunit gamma/tau [Acidobacteria bacterium]|nr:MAG: DNA polymerase III subunit gamma/tau [Acidobacteriota bacterium]